MDLIDFTDFEKIDIRIGTVLEAVVPEWSHWVIRLKVDLGPEVGEKTCFSGIMKFFKPEDLVGKQFPFVVNLKPRMIGPDKELSEVMMIMVCPGDSLPDEEKANEVPTVLFQIQESVENGTKVR